MLTSAEIFDLRRKAPRMRPGYPGPRITVMCAGGPLDGLRLHISAGLRETGSWGLCRVTRGEAIVSLHDRTGNFKGFELPGGAASGMRGTA
jgi:hypothetical protein